MNFIKKDDLKLLIGILTPAIAFIVTFYVMQNDVRYQAEKINALEQEKATMTKKLEEVQLKFTDIQITLAQIQKDIFYIKQKLE